MPLRGSRLIPVAVTALIALGAGNSKVLAQSGNFRVAPTVGNMSAAFDVGAAQGARYGALAGFQGAQFANPYYAAERGYVDDVIEPRQTRAALIDALHMAMDKEVATPRRKHGNIPL